LLIITASYGKTREQEVELQRELEKILTIPHQDACNKVVIAEGEKT